jgi:hypothetical protein
MSVVPTHSPAADSARPGSAAAPKPKASAFLRGVRSVVLAVILPISVIALWQWAGTGGSLFGGVLPTPEGVWEAWYKWAFGQAGLGLNPYSGTWFSNVVFSTQRVAQGFAVAIVVGIPLGILIGWNRLARAPSCAAFARRSPALQRPAIAAFVKRSVAGSPSSTTIRSPTDIGCGSYGRALKRTTAASSVARFTCCCRKAARASSIRPAGCCSVNRAGARRHNLTTARRIQAREI